MDIRTLKNTTSKTSNNAYIFLRFQNVMENIMSCKILKGPIEEMGTYDTSELLPLLERENKIYTNGGAEVCY